MRHAAENKSALLLSFKSKSKQAIDLNLTCLYGWMETDYASPPTRVGASIASLAPSPFPPSPFPSFPSPSAA